MAPEVMDENHCSYKTDVYSFGIIMYEICTLTVAFDTINFGINYKEPSSLPKLKDFVVEHIMQAHHETKTWSHRLSLDNDVDRRVL